jgi:hypothetical protein
MPAQVRDVGEAAADLHDLAIDVRQLAYTGHYDKVHLLLTVAARLKVQAEALETVTALDFLPDGDA